MTSGCGPRCGTASPAAIPGSFLSKADLRHIICSSADRLYGDEIYLLEPGIGIFPNFHSYIKPKAMHAYEPTDRTNGAFSWPGPAAVAVRTQWI